MYTELFNEKQQSLAFFYPWLILLVVMLISKIKPYACLSTSVPTKDSVVIP